VGMAPMVPVQPLLQQQQPQANELQTAHAVVAAANGHHAAVALLHPGP
jgi:hypothetical protein